MAAYTYPYAASPDIIRANQKDSYYTAQLNNALAGLLRTALGARTAHARAPEARVVAELLYLGVTTLIGNRTLGEEYCDIVHVEAETGRLPALSRRVAYVFSCVLVPYALARVLPRLRRQLRAKLEARIQKAARRRQGESVTSRVQAYVAQHLDTMTSPAPVAAVSLAAFYFSGSYYHLSKRIWALRYIFTRRVPPSDQRIGYEVLGVLLAVQLAVQAYLHVQGTLAGDTAASGGGLAAGPGIEVSLNPRAHTPNNALLFQAGHGRAASGDVHAWTSTPAPANARFHLADAATMAWFEGDQQRKCTLCLEEMRDPSVTTCGHVFCWSCIVDWAREKPECPLCRQQCLTQHVLPLRQ